MGGSADNDSSETDLDHWTGTLDILLAVAVGLTFYVFVLYVNLLLKERAHMSYPSVQFSNLKSAFIIPGFCFISILAMCFPHYLGVFEAFQALLEGVAIYYFYKMMEVYALNSAKMKVTDMISKVDNHIVWDYCHKNHSFKCFEAIRFNVTLFLLIRPIFSLLAGLQEILDWSKSVNNLFNALQVLCLISAMISLFRFYVSVQDHISSLDAAKKFIVIKVYILILVIQNLCVEQYTHKHGGENNSRFYSFVIICESFIVACFFVPSFNQANIASADDKVMLNDHFLTTEAKRKEEVVAMTNLQYILAVLSPFGGPNYTDEVKKLSNSLNEL